MALAILLCPRCGYADDVTVERVPDGLVRYACSARHDDGHEFIWEMTAQQATGAGNLASAGITDELLDPMLHCVDAGDPFVEYGIIEYRLSQKYPDLYSAHIHDRGHVMLAPSRVTASNSRFGPTLVRLAALGQLIKTTGTATGAWRYNGKISYWARPGTPTVPVLTWEQYCADVGRPPEWTAADRARAADSRPRN